MKRLFFLPILMLGLSFACDQPYEEVAGIKIGCPLKESDGYKGYFAGPNISGGDSHYKWLDEEGFFDTQMILSIDGVAVGVVLSSESEVPKSDFNVLIDSLKGRWGEASASRDSWESTLVVFKPLNNTSIDNIVAMREKSNGKVRVIYRSKKSVEADKKEGDEKKSSLKKGFEGL